MATALPMNSAVRRAPRRIKFVILGIVLVILLAVAIYYFQRDALH
jgi:hypothetical protein